MSFLFHVRRREYLLYCVHYKHTFSSFLEFWTIDKVHKPSDSNSNCQNTLNSALLYLCTSMYVCMYLSMYMLIAFDVKCIFKQGPRKISSPIFPLIFF
jgi:hypothetical protein